MSKLSRRKSNLNFIFLKRPPTKAAKWITCVGLYLPPHISRSVTKLFKNCLGIRNVSEENMNLPAAWISHLKSPSLLPRKTHCSLDRALNRVSLELFTTHSIALPTKPVPPVTRIICIWISQRYAKKNRFECYGNWSGTQNWQEANESATDANLWRNHSCFMHLISLSIHACLLKPFPFAPIFKSPEICILLILCCLLAIWNHSASLKNLRANYSKYF